MLCSVQLHNILLDVLYALESPSEAKLPLESSFEALLDSLRLPL